MSGPAVIAALPPAHSTPCGRERVIDRKPAAPQRVDGRSRLTVKAGNRIGDLYQRTPCRILFPRSDFAGSLEAVLINTAGGLTGGDRVRQSIAVDASAAATVTTQAAEKIYRSAAGVARIATDLSVEAGGRLEWLPQETIAFDAAALSRTTGLDLADGARALALEWLVLGRKAHGEAFGRGRIADRWRVRRDGRLVWADGFRVEGDVPAVLAGASQLDGSTAMATLLCAAPQADGLRDRVREVLDGFADLGVLGGATLVQGLVLCRVLASDGDALRPAVRRLIAELRNLFWGRRVGLPRVWDC